MKKYFNKFIKKINFSFSFLFPIKFNITNFQINNYYDNLHYIVSNDADENNINYNLILASEEKELSTKFFPVYINTNKIINFSLNILLLLVGFILWFLIIKNLQITI